MAGISMPIPLPLSILLILVLHSNNVAILAEEPTTTVVSKDDILCNSMCVECDNPCKPVRSPPPPVVVPPPPPSPPPPSSPSPTLPEYPPPPALPRPPPLVPPPYDSPPRPYYPEYYYPPPSSSFRLSIHIEASMTSIFLFLAFICYLL